MTTLVNFNRQLDALESLRQYVACLSRVEERPLQWKFALISMHSALQGCMTISLRCGNSFMTWKPRQFKKFNERFRQGESEEPIPHPQLDFFMSLFDKRFGDNSGINRDHIEWLNERRNELIHFNIDYYGFFSQDALLCCTEALSAIHKARALSDGIFFYETEHAREFEITCEEIEELHEQLNTSVIGQ